MGEGVDGGGGGHLTARGSTVSLPSSCVTRAPSAWRRDGHKFRARGVRERLFDGTRAITNESKLAPVCRKGGGMKLGFERGCYSSAEGVRG